ncbi:MAG: EAL domain-containing protein [Rhodocyclaceae bacterium]|nr:EAL domain-containing protein [Rhodocyclaceae bacterium]
MTSPIPKDDLIDFVDEPGTDIVPAGGRGTLPAWVVLVVDDDAEVHQATNFALQNTILLERPLELIHASSAVEARACLEARGSEIAVVLLDVVMETPEAGLELVPVIRRELGLDELRIILRTGQPGYAPELSVVRDYDINDYKTKSELTHVRLVTALTAAIRSYDQIRTLAASRRGLDMIVQSAGELFGRRALVSFAEGVLTQIAALLRLEPEGLICARSGSPFAQQSDSALYIVGAAGRFRSHVSRPLAELGDAEIVHTINRCMAARTSIFEAQATVLFFSGEGGRSAVVYLATERALEAVDRRMLEVFAVNIGVGFENVGLFERLNFYAYFDPLTRLPNRVRLIDEMDQFLASSSDALSQSVALIDLAHFSQVNNALGQRSGDALLMAVARRLRSAFPDSVMLSRLVGDSFALFGPARILEPEALLHIFEAPFYARGHGVPLQIRIGLAPVARAPGGQLPRAADLLRDASVALGQAKLEQGARFCTYTAEMAAQAQQRIVMLNELRAALDFHRGLKVHYQPQVDSRDGSLTGAEALLRWRRTDGGMVPPDDFIPLAEYTGLIIEIGAWVFREACEQLMYWRDEGEDKLVMAVNVSALQFRQDGFVEMIRNTLDQTGAPADRIELEITESVAMEEVDKVVEQLEALRALGVRIALDDFGCGFSSLSSLTRLPIDRLKVDRSFVAQLTDENARSGIVQTILRLAQGSGMAAIAEGVETTEQAALLQSMGCVEMQGFLFGRPMAPDEFLIWMRQNRSTLAGEAGNPVP